MHVFCYNSAPAIYRSSHISIQLFINPAIYLSSNPAILVESAHEVSFSTRGVVLVNITQINLARLKKPMWCMMLVLLLIDQSNPSSAPTFPELIMWWRKPGKKSRGTFGGMVGFGLHILFFFSSFLMTKCHSHKLVLVCMFVVKNCSILKSLRGKKNSLWMKKLKGRNDSGVVARWRKEKPVDVDH